MCFSCLAKRMGIQSERLGKQEQQKKMNLLKDGAMEIIPMYLDQETY